MTVEDLAVNRRIRNVFARNWVNLQRLDYGAVHGTVAIRGRLMLLRAQPSDKTDERDRSGVGAKFLIHLDREIKKIEGVRTITWQSDGWQRTSSGWTHRGL